MLFKRNKYVTRKDLAKEVNRILDQREAEQAAKRDHQFKEAVSKALTAKLQELENLI
jgi:hypothetical protein